MKLSRYTVAATLLVSFACAQAQDTGAANTANLTPTDPTVQKLLDRIDALEKRLGELESSAVLSEPETRVKRIEVYVDDKGNQFDQPVAGATKEVTYQRERVYRRQTISEKIEEAMASAESGSVKLGVNAAIVAQAATQSQGPKQLADGHVYELASADLLFDAHLAQYTDFFADVVGLSGSPPDDEIGGLTLLNAYRARLAQQNQLNLREAWLRTELFSQKLSISAGRLDLTSFFDNNAYANDETSQFLSDALANNPLLGLANNGAGLAFIYDPKRALNFKFGVQQSDADPINNPSTSLSQSLYSLAEVGYRARPAALGEGNYRLWVRSDNVTGRQQTAFGISADQRLTASVGMFARYGTAKATGGGDDRFYSAGFQFQNRLVRNSHDYWGLGFASTRLASGERERLAETFYNMHLSEKLHAGFHLQYVQETQPGVPTISYLVPGVRLQAGL
jgi:hypothetical protein